MWLWKGKSGESLLNLLLHDPTPEQTAVKEEHVTKFKKLDFFFSSGFSIDRIPFLIHKLLYFIIIFLLGMIKVKQEVA